MATLGNGVEYRPSGIPESGDGYLLRVLSQRGNKSHGMTAISNMFSKFSGKRRLPLKKVGNGHIGDLFLNLILLFEELSEVSEHLTVVEEQALRIIAQISRIAHIGMVQNW